MGVVTLADPAVGNKPYRTFFGDRMVRLYDLSPSSSYATNGDTVTFPIFHGGVDFLHAEDANVDATHVYRLVYDRTNGKIKVVNLIGGAEVANAVDLSAVKFHVMVVGK